MEHQRSGRLHWDTPHAATPGWLLFLDGRPGDAPTMLPTHETSLPRKASPAAVARLIGAMLQRETGQLPKQVQVTPIEEGTGYEFVATYAGPASQDTRRGCRGHHATAHHEPPIGSHGHGDGLGGRVEPDE
jgi:hypothetical protein